MSDAITKTGLAPGPLTDYHAHMIGLIIVNWSALDLAMNEALAAILRFPLHQAVLVTSRLDYKDKRDLLRIAAAGGAIPKDTQQSFERILRFIDRCSDVRNIVAHAVWTQGTAPNSIIALRLHTRGKQLKIIGIGKYQEDRKFEFTDFDLLKYAKRITVVRGFLLSFLERRNLIALKNFK